MPVVEIEHSSLGLISVEDAAALRGITARTIQRWITEGWVPALKIGGGKRAAYLLRRADVEQFTPPSPGARPKNPA